MRFGYLFLILFCLPLMSWANPAKVNGQPVPASPILERFYHEKKIPPNYIGIAFHHPNYILPYYYTGSPDNAVYAGNTPDDEQLKHQEFKFQFSVKAPFWQNMFGYPITLYGAYSQLSYWQLYTNQTFMRENDYEPELFFQTRVNWPLGQTWSVNFFNVGVDHISNGTGNDLQRSWNRIYLDIMASSEHWMFSIKPWATLYANDNNKNIAQYLGYGRFLIAGKYGQQVVSLEAYSLIEQGGKRATGNLTWSFPLTPYFKGYIQAFSGYGQSLVEYNHRTNSIGVGFALSDWV